MFEFRGKVRSYGDMQRMFADPQALHPLLSSLQVGKSAKINGDRITRLPDSDAEQQATIAAQVAEIASWKESHGNLCLQLTAQNNEVERLMEGIGAIIDDMIYNDASYDSVRVSLGNLIKPQESEVQHD